MPSLGWKKDRPPSPWHEPDQSARLKLGLTTPPPSASCRRFIPTILDQGQLGSCTCNAMAQALRASQISQHFLPVPPIPELASRLFAYYLARAYDHETSQDSGTYLRNVFMALVKFGFPPESFWPYSDDSSPAGKFTVKPPESVFSQAFDQNKITGTQAYYRIDTTGNERLLDIRRAIAAGHCVVFGTQVSEDFCSGNVDASQPLPPPIGKAIAGGHALTIGDYENDDDYGIINSWGDQVGKGGWFRFSGEYLAWDESNDFWIVSAAPQFSHSPSLITP